MALAPRRRSSWCKFCMWVICLSSTITRPRGAAQELQSTTGASSTELVSPVKIWSSNTLSMVALWDGTVIASDKDSGEIRWSFSSGPPLSSAHGLLFDNGEALNATMGVTGDPESRNDKYFFCGNDWQLYKYDKRFGTEELPVAPDELIRNTPAFLDGAVVLGSVTQTTFIVNANSGVLVRRIDSGNGQVKRPEEKIVQDHNVQSILEPITMLDNVNLLVIFRTDYSLRSVAADSGELLWNVSIGELRLHYPKIDRVQGLPAGMDTPMPTIAAQNLAQPSEEKLLQLPPAEFIFPFRSTQSSQFRGLPAGMDTPMPTIAARNLAQPSEEKLLQLPPAEIVSPFRSTQLSHLPISSLNMKDHNDNDSHPSFQKFSNQDDDGTHKAVAASPLPLDKNDFFSDILNAIGAGLVSRILILAEMTTLSRGFMVCALFLSVLGSMLLAVRILRTYSANKQDKKRKEVLIGKKKKGRKGANRNGKISDLKLDQFPGENRSVQGNRIVDAADPSETKSFNDGKSQVSSATTSLINGNKGQNGIVHGEGRWVGRLLITNTVIGYGSHGTLVLEGFLDTRNVAVKRLLGQFYEKAKKELSNLIASDEHPNVVRCYAMECDADFVYVALERCSFNLNDLILVHRFQNSGSSKNRSDDMHLKEVDLKHLIVEVGEAKNLILWDEKGRPSTMLLQFMRDIVAGLAHLHDLGIVHRDLKPQNVLISNGRICCAKLSDMGISKRLVDNASSVDTYSAGVGSSGWQAPEQLLSHRQTRAVDLFSLGCVLFFCISGGNHPFGSRFERDGNIVNSQPDLFPVEHIPEATQLLSVLLDRDPRKRSTVKEVLWHPLFWSPEKRLSFLRDASDRVELEDRANESSLLDVLEAAAPAALGGAWDEKLEGTFLENLGHYRRYNYRSVRDLLRVIRNKSNHYRELPQEVQKLVGPMPNGYEIYFRNKFPHLLIEIYKILYDHCKGEAVFQIYFYGQG